VINRLSTRQKKLTESHGRGGACGNQIAEPMDVWCSTGLARQSHSHTRQQAAQHIQQMRNLAFVAIDRRETSLHFHRGQRLPLGAGVLFRFLGSCFNAFVPPER
jgi:hypothetical protein